MFRVEWKNFGEYDINSNDYNSIVYEVSAHRLSYTTCSGVKHFLDCDFSGIFEKIHNIVSSDAFRKEKPCEHGCDGDWYIFEYTYGNEHKQYQGYIYGLPCHTELIDLIRVCAGRELREETKLLRNLVTSDERDEILKRRQDLHNDFLDYWEDIEG